MKINLENINGSYFVSGIHTDAGKSYCTGWLARQLLDTGKSVITQKFVQTGNHEFSEDIELHRKIMGINLLPDDLNHTTAPIIFTHPCSPQLAAAIDNQEINIALIDKATDTLLSNYDVVLVEGAGGLMVPLTDEFLTIDYISSRKLPLIFVVNGSLGSINHALLSFEAIKSRKIDMPIVLYNQHFDYDPLIAADTHGFIERYLHRFFPDTQLIDGPNLQAN